MKLLIKASGAMMVPTMTAHAQAATKAMTLFRDWPVINPD